MVYYYFLYKIITDNSFVFGQGNKTIHYEHSKNILYVFGNNDNCELGFFSV